MRLTVRDALEMSLMLWRTGMNGTMFPDRDLIKIRRLIVRFLVIFMMDVVSVFQKSDETRVDVAMLDGDRPVVQMDMEMAARGSIVKRHQTVACMQVRSLLPAFV